VRGEKIHTKYLFCEKIRLLAQSVCTVFSHLFPFILREEVEKGAYGWRRGGVRGERPACCSCAMRTRTFWIA
jgi:hypothetical protein